MSVTSTPSSPSSSKRNRAMSKLSNILRGNKRRRNVIYDGHDDDSSNSSASYSSNSSIGKKERALILQKSPAPVFVYHAITRPRSSAPTRRIDTNTLYDGGKRRLIRTEALSGLSGAFTCQFDIVEIVKLTLALINAIIYCILFLVTPRHPAKRSGTSSSFETMTRRRPRESSIVFVSQPYAYMK